MKRILLAILFTSTAAFSQNEYAFQVKVNHHTTLAELVASGYLPEDVRIQYDVAGKTDQFDWLPENNFVTVTGDRTIQARLSNDGFEVLSSRQIIRKSYKGNPSYPLQFGWPRVMDGWPSVYGQATTVADFNGNGDLELFLSNIEGFMYMWRNNGTFVLGYPRTPINQGWSTASREGAAAGDIDGDGQLETILGQAEGFLRANTFSSLPPNGFPHALGNWKWTNEPALYDFDNDGKDEIVLVTYDYPTAVPEGPALLHIFNEDFTELPGWPQQLLQHSESSPAIGDIDGDGEMEIVVGSGRSIPNDIAGELNAFNLDGTKCSGFPILVGPDVHASPALYDIDMNGTLDILIRLSPDATGVNGIYAYDGTGQQLPGFPAVITRGGSKNGVPAIADVNGDGLPEIAYGTIEAVDSARVWLFDNAGQIMPGFPQPVFATWVEESVVLEDVSGDGLADIVCGTNGVGSDYAKVWAFDHTGSVIPDFPIAITETFSTLETTPTIIDFDGDGDTEIITVSHEGTVHIFDTPGIPSASSWPTFKYNAARHSSNPASITGLEEPFTPTIPRSSILFPLYPNPFNPTATIRFSLALPQSVTIEAYNILGAKIAVLLDNEHRAAGDHSIRFEGGKLASGIYFIYLQAGEDIHIQKALLSR